MMTKTKTLTISSVFPAAPEDVWPLLTRVETLRYIAFPYAVFISADGMKRTEWREGETLRFRLRVFGFLPLGIHTIRVAEMNRDTYTIRSQESNHFVPVWNHTITLKPYGENATEYTDTIELGAGRLTEIVAPWSRSFYRHRQRKWRKLLMKEMVKI
jgi:ligand-binding SRPBCC domain-containing protein